VNKTTTLLLAALLLAPLAALHAADTAPPTSNENLVINPGFEQGLQGWWVHPRNNPRSGVVKSRAHSGQGALRVWVSNDNRFPDGTFDHYWDPLFCIEYLRRWTCLAGRPPLRADSRCGGARDAAYCHPLHAELALLAERQLPENRESGVHGPNLSG
jgi:hypothetical protein